MRLKVLAFLVSFVFQMNGQELLLFKVSAGDYDRIDCPISFQFSASEYNLQNKDIQLVELQGDARIEKPIQFDNRDSGRLWFILDGKTPKQTIRKFALIKRPRYSNLQQIDLLFTKGSLQIALKNRPILNYEFGMTLPPEGIDQKYKKSGFIHPVWSPEGEILTRIQPPDHYHHYGIWGPWTKTQIGERQVDFWNLGEGQGTVLFKKFLDTTQGPVFSGFTALQEHIDLGATDENSIAINEELKVQVWNIGLSNNSWLVDYTSEISSPLESGIIFKAYHYGGGIGFRATEKWHKDNSSVLTSEKKDRISADGSSAKWAIIEGASNTVAGRSGILFMGFPKNRQFPEPMRVWPIDENEGRGDLFFEFCPIRHVDWNIEFNKKYRLKYRMLIFEGELTYDQAEIYWQCFANPPEIIIEPKN